MDQPIDNYFMVEAEGGVNLGPAYGTVRVLGMTLDEAKKAIEQNLSQVLHEPKVSLKLARVSGSQPLTAQYLVAPDGTVNLRQYGLVHVAGMAVPEAQLAIQKHLTKFLSSPELSVDVVAYKSKNYYVVTEGAATGDSVNRFLIAGNETVLDALCGINGLSHLSRKKIWLVRPSAADAKKGTVLPIDWAGITRRGATETNYQIFPGDRLFIADEERAEPPAIRREK
jgi:protein involved in polysaccharide export with SLBB domain